MGCFLCFEKGAVFLMVKKYWTWGVGDIGWKKSQKKKGLRLGIWIFVCFLNKRYAMICRISHMKKNTDIDKCKECTNRNYKQR